jgi:hypothetical protein
VIEHQRGYRASHAYPLRLEEISPSTVLDAIGAVTVLFLEVDNVIRRLGAEMLRGRGCRVYEAANGAAASEILRQCADGIDVLLAGTDGRGSEVRALIDAAARIRPEMTVLVNSGRFLAASFDGRGREVADRGLALGDPFAHPLSRSYGVPVIAPCA